MLFLVNERMALSPNGAKLLAVIPADRLLTETDGPFTKAAGGRPSSPLDVHLAVKALASTLQRSEDEVADDRPPKSENDRRGWRAISRAYSEMKAIDCEVQTECHETAQPIIQVKLG